jgi:adenine-specific DNA-methyltransferase
MKIDYIKNCDCLSSEGLASIPDGSVDCIITDPPYFKVMREDYKGDKYDWDDQWDDLDSYLDWMDSIFIEFNRVLKPNGSIYIYADSHISAYVQVRAEKIFSLMNVLTWVKTNGMTSKYWKQLRTYADATESILFFEKKGASGLPKTGLQEIYSNEDCFTSIKSYMRAERDKLMESKGFTKITQFNDYIDELTETKSIASHHYFADSQYAFPTCEMYAKMQKSGFWQRPYETSCQEYEALRRPFHPADNFTNVWTSMITTSIEGGVDHPTQKPVMHIERMIETSTNPGAVVLDAFMGSGTTAVACVRTGRHYVGFEQDPDYHKGAIERIAAESRIKKSTRTLDDF